MKMRGVLRSGWLTSGKNVKNLEAEFAKYVGTESAVAVNSCTAALHAILLAMGVKQGDEVIVPSNTFVATANAALYVGAKPVFADSDPATFNLSPEDVSRKVSPRTRAIIPVHLGGNPCEMKALGEIAEDHHIALIEDCAHAHGAKFQGKLCGSFGVASAFSFYATKIMTTGEGGIVTTDDAELAEKIRRIRNHGRGGYGPMVITDLGFNYRMPDLLAVIGLSQLKRLGESLNERNELAKEYSSFLSATPWLKPQGVSEGNFCSYYVYICRLMPGAPITQEEMIEHLSERGVGTSVLYYPVQGQPLYKLKGERESECPVASELGHSTLALPLYNGMERQELQYVKEQLHAILEPLAAQHLRS